MLESWRNLCLFLVKLMTGKKKNKQTKNKRLNGSNRICLKYPSLHAMWKRDTMILCCTLFHEYVGRSIGHSFGNCEVICGISRTSRLHIGNCRTLNITIHEGSCTVCEGTFAQIIWTTLSVTCDCHEIPSYVSIALRGWRCRSLLRRYFMYQREFWSWTLPFCSKGLFTFWSHLEGIHR